MSTGKVWLVGAGPGDIGLFTIKGMETLKNAEVVVYDSLVGQGVSMWANELPTIPCPRKRSMRSWWKRQRKDSG